MPYLAGLQMFIECSLFSGSAIEGLGGSIKKRLLVRWGDIIDEELWVRWLASLSGRWAVLGLLYDRDLSVTGSSTHWEKAPCLQETHFLVSCKSISLGRRAWEMPHQRSWEERKPTYMANGSCRRGLWEMWAEAHGFLPNFLILCYVFLVCPWKETNCH